jgi:DNA-binding winged helix-turn-helix (wHTH) protein
VRAHPPGGADLIYRFVNFELDEERCELRRGSKPLPIARKSFDVLRHLVHHAGRVVSKEELFALIWPGEHVNDHVLPVHIRTIRKLLDEPDSNALIRTVRGRGYSLVCAVEVETVRSSVMGTAPESPGPFVGRAALLEQFQASLASSSSGRGRVLVLSGDAGIGKTRALDELAHRAARQGAIVVHARGELEPGVPPFWTLLELFCSGRSALEAVAAASPEVLESAELVRARRRMRALFERQRAGGVEPGCARFEVGRVARDLVTQVTRLAPLVVVIDDLHLVDEDSLSVWAAAVRRLHEQRVLMIAAYRSEALAAHAPFARALGALATERALEPLRLRGLDDEAVHELVRAQLGERPPASFVRALQERTEGNPFFIRELLRELGEQGGARGHAASWDLARAGLSCTAREAIERQLARVSADCRHLLGWAAVIGRRFSFPLLGQVAGLDAARLLEHLREASDVRVIDYAGDGDQALGEYHFAYPWLREVLYARLSGPERVLRHRAVGAALEQRRAGDADLAELAHHFFQAAPGGDIDRAASYCAGAARQALASFAFDDAVRHLQRALRAEELRTPPDPLRFCCVTLALGDVLRRAGRYDESRARLLAAAQDARQLGRDDLLAYCALALAKWPSFAGPKVPFQSGQGPGEDQRQEVVSLVLEAFGRLDAGAQAECLSLRARVIAARARVEATSGRLGSAASLGEQALELARRSQDPRALFDALLARRAAQHVPQDAASALNTSSELVRTAKRLRAQPLLFNAYALRIPALVALGAMSEAGADLAELSAIAKRLRAPEHGYTAACFELGRALSEGQLALARSWLPRVRALGFAAGDLDVTWKNRMIKLWLLYAEGCSARARTSVEALVDRTHVRAPGFHVFHAEYWRGIGDARRCAAHFEQAAAENFDDFERDDDWLWDLALCAHVCAFLGDRRRAQQLYERIAPFAKLNVTCSLYVYRGSAHFPLAMLAGALGESALACGHFEAAIEFNRRIEARSALLFAEAQYGRALLRGGADERARGSALLEQVTREAGERGVLRLRRAAELHAEM